MQWYTLDSQDGKNILKGTPLRGVDYDILFAVQESRQCFDPRAFDAGRLVDGVFEVYTLHYLRYSRLMQHLISRQSKVKNSFNGIQATSIC